MFTGIASITTNSFAINVDVTDTSVGFLSARIQCSLAEAGFSPHCSWRVLRNLLLGGRHQDACSAHLVCKKIGLLLNAMTLGFPLWHRTDPSCSSTLHTLLWSSKIKDRFPHSLKLSGDPQFFFITLSKPAYRREKSKVLICHADKPRILRLSCVSNDAN